MVGKSKFRKLLEPYQIGSVKLRNRMVKSGAIVSYATEDGYVTERLKDYYEALAKGGVGMIITEATCVDYPLGNGRHYYVRACEDKFIPSLREWAQVTHKYGCPIFLQLSHSGPSHPQSRYGLQPVAASSLTKEESPDTSFDTARELTVVEIKDIVDKFAKAGERAQKAGFDGVELHFGHNYLGNSFFSRAWNKRRDAYGCQDLISRTKFAVEVIEAIRGRVGAGFPIGVRINGREWGTENGLTSEETQGIAQILSKACIDYIHVTGYGYKEFGRALFPEQILYPEPKEAAKPFVKTIKKPGLLVPSAEAIKRAVSVPVIAVGGLSPELGEWLIEKGKVDLVAFTRRLQADPELPNKVASGKLDDIVPCTGCYTCVNFASLTKPVQCRVNPAMGREREYVLKPTLKKKRVMVVGSGPAGMEVARVAALRGHEVLLYEREHKLGGLLPLAALIKGTEIEDLPALVHYFQTQIVKLGVKVKLGQEVSLKLIEEIKPDVVILATGGIPAVPPIPGYDKRNVTSSSKVHRKVEFFLKLLGPNTLRWLTKFYLPIGKSVVIIGGHIHGCEAAEFLVKRGRKVTITETSNQIGDGLLELHRPIFLSWLTKKGVNVITGIKYDEITDQGLTISKDGQTRIIEADTVFIALPPEPNTDLLKTLQGKVPEVYLIGDGKKPNLIINAIEDGRRVGCSL